MKGTRVIGLFCDDIREEKSGQDTIIGILPDNMNVAKYPSVTPKLGLYLRVHIDPKNPASKIVAKFKTPWDQHEIGGADEDLIKQAVDQANEKKLPLGGIVLKALIVPFQMQK